MATATRQHGRRIAAGRPARTPLAVSTLGVVTLAVAALVTPVSTVPRADAAPADLVPPASGILPGPAPSDSSGSPGAWGPCVPDDTADDSCDGWMLPPGQIVTEFAGTDDAPSVIVGGDFEAGLGSAEAEGLLVVAGDATFAKTYNVGVAGGGSGVVPAHRADMLVVGGDATVANPSEDPLAGGNAANVGVGLATADDTRFGAIHVGGAWNFRDPSFDQSSSPYGTLGQVDTANQDPPATEFQNILDDDVDVLADDHYTDLFGVEGKMSRYSQQCYAELSTTTATEIVNEAGPLTLEQGTVTQDGGGYVLTSDGSGDLVVFDLPATVGTLGGPGAPVRIDGVADDATVLINTLAVGAVQHQFADVTWDGVGNDALNSALQRGSSILWNYPFATTLAIGGATQFPGAVLVGDPASVTTLGFSGNNGRIYTPGDLLHSGSSFSTSGNEMHGNRFDGALGCAHSLPGTFSIAKTVQGDAADSVPAGTTFTVAWEVTGPQDSPNLGTTGTLDVTADGTPVVGPADLAEGDEITFSEPAFPDIEGVGWGDPAIDPNPIVVGAEGTTAAATVANTATAQRGGFSIAKTVTGDDGAATTAFTGTWTCDTANAAGDDSGTWTLSDGATVTVDGFPLGTSCTLTEDPVDDDNGTWTSSVSPARITITDTDPTATLVTVTNEFSSAIGAFQISKVVEGDPGSGVTEFTVAWTCTTPEGRTSSGEVTVTGGGTSDPVGDLPVGTACTISEAEIDDPDGSWSAEVTPAQLVIGSDDATAIGVVTVTNTFQAPTPAPSPSPSTPAPTPETPAPGPGPTDGPEILPQTGAEVLTWAIVAVGLVVVGVLTVLVVRRRLH